MNGVELQIGRVGIRTALGMFKPGTPERERFIVSWREQARAKPEPDRQQCLKLLDDVLTEEQCADTRTH